MTPAEQPAEPASERPPGPAADVVVTRSEQRLAVQTQVTATERVTVSTYVVTEEVTRTFTLRRQEIRVDRHSLDDAVPAPSAESGAFVDSEHEIVLYGEEPVIDIRVIPVERVRISKYSATHFTEVSAELAREHVDVHTPLQRTPRKRRTPQ